MDSNKIIYVELIVEGTPCVRAGTTISAKHDLALTIPNAFKELVKAATRMNPHLKLADARMIFEYRTAPPAYARKPGEKT